MNLGVLAPETNSWGDLVEIQQKIVQIGALAATFWAKTDFLKISSRGLLSGGTLLYPSENDACFKHALRSGGAE